MYNFFDILLRGSKIMTSNGRHYCAVNKKMDRTDDTLYMPGQHQVGKSHSGMRKVIGRILSQQEFFGLAFSKRANENTPMALPQALSNQHSLLAWERPVSDRGAHRFRQREGIVDAD